MTLVGLAAAIGAFGLSSADARPAPLFSFTLLIPNGPGSDDVEAIYVARLDEIAARRLTAPCVDCADSARWSPDGHTLAYDGIGTDSESGIFLMAPDGRNKRRLCGEPGTAAAGCSFAAAWSPDGKELAIAIEEGANRCGVGIIGADGAGFHFLPHTRGYCGVTDLDWSPDGRQIAFEVGFESVDVIGIDGRGARRIATHAIHPRWSPDGRLLLFASDTGKTIWTWRDGQRPRAIHTSPGYRDYQPEWWPDGQHLEYTAENGFHSIDLATGGDHFVAALPAICTLHRKSCADFEFHTG